MAKLAPVPDLDAELDALFAGPLEEFTAKRNALARALRKANQEDAAGRVAELKKPALPVWAINQLVRAEPDLTRELLTAARQLTGKQQRAAGAEAMETHRDRLRRLVGRASQAAGRPLSDDVRLRIATTLRGASLDPEASDALARGQLDREVEASGFELAASVGIAPEAPGAAPRASQQRELRQLERDRRAGRKALQAMRAKVEAAEQHERRVLDQAEAARTKRERLAQELDETQQELDVLDRRIDELSRSRG